MIWDERYRVFLHGLNCKNLNKDITLKFDKKGNYCLTFNPSKGLLVQRTSVFERVQEDPSKFRT